MRIVASLALMALLVAPVAAQQRRIIIVPQQTARYVYAQQAPHYTSSHGPVARVQRPQIVRTAQYRPVQYQQVQDGTPIMMPAQSSQPLVVLADSGAPTDGGVTQAQLQMLAQMIQAANDDQETEGQDIETLLTAIAQGQAAAIQEVKAKIDNVVWDRKFDSLQATTTSTHAKVNEIGTLLTLSVLGRAGVFTGEGGARGAGHACPPPQQQPMVVQRAGLFGRARFRGRVGF